MPEDVDPERVIAGRFRLQRKLGAGAFGEAFLAEDVERSGRVVVKLLRAEHAKSEEIAERFRREVRALERLVHPLIPALVAAGTDEDGRPYYACEYCEGVDLQQSLEQQSGPWAVRRVARLLRDVLDALETAHAAGVVHRDLKPANLVLVTRPEGERAMLIDFGIAKHLTGGEQTVLDLTKGRAVGTPYYLSPEQAEGEVVDGRSDLYALGAIAYELLAGERPVKGTTVNAILNHILNKDPAPLREKRTDVPPALSTLIHRLLAKEPKRRPASAAEVRALLDEAVPPGPEVSVDAPTDAPAAPPPPAAAGEAELLGRKVAGKYELREHLGSGGFGSVYRAWHEELGIDVALKLIRPPGEDAPEAEREEAHERFRREARAMRAFVHKHAVQVRDFGRDGPLFYLEMDYLRGETLADLLRREAPLPEERVLRIGGQVLSALAEAHRAGIVHRDLKPANIMLVREHGEEEARILDFGIVKLIGALEDESSLRTAKGSTIGTVQYMSPEQAGGDEIGPPSDVYSLAVVLYLCLAGRLPIDGGKEPSQASLRARIMTKPPRPLDEAAPGLSSRTVAAVHHALAKDPAERPADAGAFAQELLGGTPHLLLPATRLDLGARPSRRHGRSGLIVGGLAVLAAAALALLALHPGARALLATHAPSDGELVGGAGVVSAVGTDGPARTDPPRADSPEGDAPLEVGLLSPPADALLPAAHPVLVVGRARGAGPFEVTLELRRDGASQPPIVLEVGGRGVFRHELELAPGAFELAVVARDARGRSTSPLVRRFAVDRLPTSTPAEATPLASWWDELPPGRRPPLPLPVGLVFGQAPGTYVNERDGSVLVYVPEGPFVWGKERRHFELPGFFIGRLEVTRAQLRAAGVDVTASPGASELEPATNVTWSEARAYCAWAGLRLPSEAEWEKAARGTEGAPFPWGDEALQQGGRWLLNCEGEEDGFAGAAPVGSFPAGVSPFGCLDMAGNAVEWCSDEKQERRVVKGGGYRSQPRLCRPEERMAFLPDMRRDFLGFRVARSVDDR